MKKYLFLDRDGTLIREPQDYQVDTLEKISFLPQVIGVLKKLIANDYHLVLVSNQDGLGTEKYPQSAFDKVQNFILTLFQGEGIHFEAILIDSHFPEDQHPNRKPETGMLIPLLSQGKVDLERSYVIGDRPTDAQLAANIGCGSITINDPDSQSSMEKWEKVSTQKFSSWLAIEKFLLNSQRLVTLSRQTKETDITLTLNLDGEGVSQIDTGLNFFNHMLENFTKHAEVDLQIVVKGDLEVDEHHTIEDTAITLGEAFKKALGSKRGIERYGFTLPMDEALVSCSLDLSGRAYCLVDMEITREYVGDFPVEMLKHFYHSFCLAAGMNLNLKIEGENEHHKIEASFKAVARSLKQAIKISGEHLPSTKGML